MSSDVSTDCSVMSAGELNEKRKTNITEKEVILAWKNVTVSAERKLPRSGFWSRSKTETFDILKNVSGYTKSGVLTAIMGASGAGKTTFLATISKRAKLKCSGEVIVNNRILSRELMSKLSGFVPQHDLVFKSLSVKEHMEFMARLMMDQRLRKIHRNRRIYCLLSELGLLRCCRTHLGNLSGGEMKRLSLAVQLLTDPPILFCDEPTTGLDSYSAGVVLENLRHFAERGKAVICTIHQPASGHFELFHEVILLAGGRVAYSGLVSEASGYFNSVGLVCPSIYNPAEFYVQQLAVLPGKEVESQNRNNWLCDQFLASARGKEVEQVVSQEFLVINSSAQPRSFLKGNWSTHSSTTSESVFENEPDVEREFKAYLSIERPHILTQLYWLTWRSFKDLVRNCANTILRFVLFMFIAFLISTPYIGISQDLNQKTIQNMQGFMYLIITEVVFTFSYSVFHTFPAEIPVLLRELANGLYQPGPYYVSKMAIVLPKSVIEATLYALFVYFVAELQGGFSGFIIFAIPVIFSALSATAYGSLMSAAFESITTANLVSVPIEMITLMFCGVFLQLQNTPPYLSWIKYTSQFYYGQEAVSITQWHQITSIELTVGLMLEPRSTESIATKEAALPTGRKPIFRYLRRFVGKLIRVTSFFYLLPASSLRCYFVECAEDPTLPCISDGDGVLNKYGYHRNNYYTDLIGLGSLYCVSHLLGFIALLRRSRQHAIY